MYDGRACMSSWNNYNLDSRFAVTGQTQPNTLPYEHGRLGERLSWRVRQRRSSQGARAGSGPAGAGTRACSRSCRLQRGVKAVANDNPDRNPDRNPDPNPNPNPNPYPNPKPNPNPNPNPNPSPNITLTAGTGRECRPRHHPLGSAAPPSDLSRLEAMGAASRAGRKP